jgi:dipeptidyl aminopeptidase/acylaminoacyl peptidase
MKKSIRSILISIFISLTSALLVAAEKPLLTLDEFFNSVSFGTPRISPDGRAVVIPTQRADWDRNIFRKDLWLYRDDVKGRESLNQLTQSGYDSDPEWSPDGRWIAFLSSRSTRTDKSADKADKDKGIAQLYLISPDGGEAFAVTEGEDDVHAFAWSADSRTLYFATQIPWTRGAKSRHEKEWKDVLQYRGDERGDLISAVEVATVVARRHAAGVTPRPEEQDSDLLGTPGAHPVTSVQWKIDDLRVSRDGKKLAFLTTSVSERQELVSEFEIFVADLSSADKETVARQLTKNEAVERRLQWASDSHHLFFTVDLGSVTGKYKDTQTHLYWVDSDSGEIQPWASDFDGHVTSYSLTPDGGVVASGMLGTETQMYSQPKLGQAFQKLAGWEGTYDQLATATGSPRVAFVHSTLERPTEVYLAESPDRVGQARALTSFNKLLSERALPKGKPYRWKSDDGTSVEGMLIYPPGKFEAKNLPMFVLIHGGPADADGNHWEADWYQWSALAATQGWLVFQPNYRGSAGYGDKFLSEIVPEIVSRPGKDILLGVDALVKDGVADRNRLAVGGYSYGGYMTNWLITQTARFKAAVTGAGAVEHVANWGNDDTTFDDAYFLGGRPWEAQQRYHDEAAIYQIDKVRTPTHMVGGADDIRVAVLENYLLDHALHALGVPSTLLIFPGEGHSLAKNPWHGKIKVREELKWLEKYGGISPTPK